MQHAEYHGAIEPPQSRGDTAAGKRLRIVPAAASFLIGAASFAFGVFAVAVMTYVLLTEPAEETFWGMVAGCISYLGFGTAWMLAGRLYWQRWYSHALLANAIGISLPIVLFATLGF